MKKCFIVVFCFDSLVVWVFCLLVESHNLSPMLSSISKITRLQKFCSEVRVFAIVQHGKKSAPLTPPTQENYTNLELIHLDWEEVY